MCGIIGVISKNTVIGDGLTLLNAENNRGEQSCGAVTQNSDGLGIKCYYGEGKVADVFGPRDQHIWSQLTGNVFLGHVLYSTVGKIGAKIQPQTKQPVPFEFGGKAGYVAHNGNLVGLEKLRKYARRLGHKFQSHTSDTEVVAALLSVSKKKDFLGALLSVLRKIEGKGAFSLVIMYGGKLYGLRDQNGIRPLCIIKKSGRGGDEDSYIFASESSVFPTLDATRIIRHVSPGELVVMGTGGIEKSVQWTENTKPAFCVCELIYLANPASRFFGVGGPSVSTFRFEAGRMCAKKHPVKARFVMPIPDSGRGYSDGFASASGIESREGVIKSRYAGGRTFMQPRHISRRKLQKAKLQVLIDVMENQDICLVEDSIFRASVGPVVVSEAREHGRAIRVHMRVCSPPVKYRCHLGLDTSTSGELVASHMTVEEIRDRVILSDTLEYLTVNELKQVLRNLGLNPNDFCLGCFTGEYPVDPPKEKFVPLLVKGKRL